jgi:hypothetical protein
MSYTWDPKPFNKELEKEYAARLLKSSLVVEKRAKIICPKVTSRLASSITHVVIMDARTRSAFIIGGGVASDGTIVDYAIHVEIGTRFFAGRFYLRRGIRESMSEIRVIWGIAA